MYIGGTAYYGFLYLLTGFYLSFPNFSKKRPPLTAFQNETAFFFDTVLMDFNGVLEVDSDSKPVSLFNL